MHETTEWNRANFERFGKPPLPKTRYLLALGSNRRHVRHGSPRAVIEAASDRLDDAKLAVIRRSKILESRPIGPSRRRYANAAAIVETAFGPASLLVHLHALEHEYGRRRGQRWSSRVLDMDIILWEGGMFAGVTPPLVIPHREMRNRGFVLGPAREIAPGWRDPLSGLTITQLWWRWKHRQYWRQYSPKPA